MANLKIKLVKSLNGRLEKHIATAQSLGLRKIGNVTIQPDNTQTRGKIAKIGFMLQVTEVESGGNESWNCISFLLSRVLPTWASVRAAAMAAATVRLLAVVTRVSMPDPAARSALVSKVARCLWFAAFPSVVSTTSLQSP